MYYAKGSPKNPFSDEEVNNKFRGLALPKLKKKGLVEEIIQTITNIETVKNVRQLAALLA
jgi:2-methylcitrate dehydratase PrpD